MKRRVSYSIALVLSIALLSLMNSNSRAQSQVHDADTGLIGPLGPDQVLRITTVNTSQQAIVVRFRQVEYMPGTCNGGVCKQVPMSQMTSDPIALAPNEGAWITITSGVSGMGVRGIVQNGGQGTKNQAHIIDSSSGKLVAAFEF